MHAIHIGRSNLTRQHGSLTDKCNSTQDNRALTYHQVTAFSLTQLP